MSYMATPILDRELKKGTTKVDPMVALHYQ
jgi:hypothetical protein